jgi:amidophosphoribosyltransferase
MCAIFGITGHEEAANLTYLGLHAQQHRGQEGSGIVSTDGVTAYSHRRKGLVQEAFTPSSLSRLKGTAAIGHNRYSTAGGSSIVNFQPLLMRGRLGSVAVAHNGNLVNADLLTEKLAAEGSLFQSTNDTEVILHLIAKSRKADLVGALTEALQQVEGAYSLLVMNEEQLIAVRDPFGFRPLVMGSFKGCPVFASETCAFDLIDAEYKREVEPGEMVVISLKTLKMETHSPFKKKEPRRCVFEYVYFSRPDSLLFGENVHEMRKALGRQLAKEQPAPGVDVVIPVPDSGVPAAIGFAEQSGTPFDMGIIRSHYIGRTFIEPKQSIRDFGVKLKLNPVSPCVQGKNIVVVDDSLVRGTTSRKLIQHLRDSGAREVHMRISAPPTSHSCFYGIDTPTRSELLASSNSVREICRFIGADSLGYLSLEGLMSVASPKKEPGFCNACFSGNYPTPVEGQV